MNDPLSVLIVEDDPHVLLGCQQALALEDIASEGVASAELALQRIGEDFAGIVVSDIRLPGIDGLELLGRLKQRDPSLPVVLITGHGDIGMAVNAMRDGAYDFMEKPFSPERLVDVVRRALEQRGLAREVSALRRQLAGRQALEQRIIGRSSAVQKLRELIANIADTAANVLIEGETGTGKELVARAIHDCGFRRSRPFVVQNCASLPENLLESELFGYRKGAFTGADRDHQGLFDAADGGTLFLDEIGDMPLSLQAKLLRVLQEGEVRPLGSNTTHKVDVRIVAATHCALREQVEEGRFREDLFYRLAQFPIELPPLRERDQDILTLARHFADKASALLQRDPCRWADSTLEHLSGYAFPGNVRELKGVVERAVLLCEGGELLPAHFNLRQDYNADDTGMNLRERMERVERSLLLDCLRKNRGNQTNAACELGLPRRTLLYRMRRLHISPADV